MASSRLSKTTLMLGAIIICALLMLASPTDAQQSTGGFDQENKGPIAAALTEDPIITSNSDPAATFYSNEIVMKILGIVRGSLPNATDNEILIMLSLWIWGFSMLNVILTVLLCCCRHVI